MYVQQNGAWVDETSPAEATRYSGRIMLDAEQLALNSCIPASVVRLTGIYGPGREWLLGQVRKGYRVERDPPLYGNRIHADDAGGLLTFLLEEPAPLADVVDWLRGQVGVTQWSDEASVRRAGSKRCSNARARALGWEPRYPSYREGYAAILAGQS